MPEKAVQSIVFSRQTHIVDTASFHMGPILWSNRQELSSAYFHELSRGCCPTWFSVQRNGARLRIERCFLTILIIFSIFTEWTTAKLTVAGRKSLLSEKLSDNFHQQFKSSKLHCVICSCIFSHLHNRQAKFSVSRLHSPHLDNCGWHLLPEYVSCKPGVVLW